MQRVSTSSVMIAVSASKQDATNSIRSRHMESFDATAASDMPPSFLALLHPLSLNQRFVVLKANLAQISYVPDVIRREAKIR